ncbi:hypothetical protein PIB30_072599 [Stylosanthes scabra]|uniref:F-box domain-containing protein n=1 Tax=Stylosanthes scabra TaxID=79078 RepID=A0ABU6RP39_9FABA|nr:hypothetical protein [Stylosanthes scabra]
MASSSKQKVSLPNDLVLNILSRLPVKSLKRFSCVQKSWANFLEDPHFIDMYYEDLTSKTRDSDSWLLLKQQLPNTFKSDLYLLSGESYKNRVKIGWTSPFQEDSGNIIIVGSCINGFGYDHVTDDYKILQNVVTNVVDYDYNIEENPHIRGESWQIYSVNNNCWRIIDLEMRFAVLPLGVCHAVYLNGVCHWLAFQR